MSLHLKLQSILQNKKVQAHYLGEVRSTNDWAKKSFDPRAPQLQVFLADKQTHGRGRFDRSWEDSLEGGQIFSTWVYSLDSAPACPPLTTGLELHRRLFANQRFKLPNDILDKDGKKLSGILCELVSGPNGFHLFVGLGINLSSKPALACSASLDLTPDEQPNFLEELADCMLELESKFHQEILTYQEHLCKHAWIKDGFKVTGFTPPLSFQTTEGVFLWSDL